MLSLFSGVDIYSVTVIVAAFMGGLGCGSLCGGVLADKLKPKNLLDLFSFCELSIAFFAILSHWLYYDLLYLRLYHLAESPVILSCLLFVSLLWPTFFMGMSLPLLSKALTREVRAAPATIGGLYGINTLGAACGAFISGWILGRLLGFETTIKIGAALNCLCALGCFLMARRFTDAGPTLSHGPLPSTQAPDQGIPDHKPPDANSIFSFRVWMLIYGLSGFTALSLEIVWFRLLAVMAKAVAFTFANLLTLYLVGLSAGTLLGIWVVRKIRKPASVFFVLQGTITLYSAFSISVLAYMLGRSPSLDGIWSYLNMDDTFPFGPALFAVVNHMFSFNQFPPEIQNFAVQLFNLYFLIPLFLIGPPTLIMGLSFPFLQKVVQTDASALGRRVGWLQTANILGCTLGTVLTSWIFLKYLGTSGTLKALILFGAVFLALGMHARPFHHRSLKTAYGSAVFALVSALVLLTPDSSYLWAKLHGTTPEQTIVEEDGSGLSLLKTGNQASGRTIVYVDGVNHSSLPYGGIHTILGALPALLHPNPKEIAVIGLGSGDTAFSIGCRQETKEITCFEIIAPQISTLRLLNRRKNYEGLRSLLDDSRFNLRLGDGRAAIMQGEKKYDVIEADALLPYSAYAGNLYSLEYFVLLRNRLKPGGFAVTWAPTARVSRTFLKAFPFVLVFHFGPIFVGSNEPIEYDVRTIRQRLDNHLTSSYYSEVGIDPESLKRTLTTTRVDVITPDFDRYLLTDLNLDLFPKDEYLLP